jgi:hypothetical protein
MIICAASAVGACHVIIPGGSGTRSGSDWNNALAGIPTTLIRGDIYYLADGTYPSYTFNQSGTATVEIRKAQSYDHCSDTGWNSATMGSSQAVFATNRQLAIYSPGLIINGNGQQTTPGCGGAVGNDPSLSPANPPDCGIKIDNSKCSSTSQGACSDPVSDGGLLTGGFTLKYVELRGMGNATSENYFIRADDSTGTVIQHCYGHYMGAVGIVAGGTSNLEESYNYWFRFQVVAGSNPGHGQVIEVGGGSNNGLVHHNVYRDGSGTAIYTFLTNGTSTGWKFYDNVYWNTAGFKPLFPLANGILACINSGVICNSFTFINNTIVGMPSGTLSGILSENGGSYTVQNNLWYGNGGTPGFLDAGTFTVDHNSVLNSGTGCSSTNSNVCNNASANPFTNWQAGDFTLASSAANWNNRVALATPYDKDMLGTTYTTDRGAYQSNSGSSKVAAPSSLSNAVR